MIRLSAVLALLALLPSTTRAVTWGIEPNENGTYDATVSTDPGGQPAFAADMFIQAIDGAVISSANTNGNPFARAFSNDDPPGNPDAILVGGSDLAGACEISGADCFSDAACGGESCIFGQSGDLKLGEINWNGEGTLILQRNSSALDPFSNCLCITDPNRTTLPAQCRRPSGELVLASADANGNGVPNACECGDSNYSGQFESDDFWQLRTCLFDHTSCGLEPHATAVFKGDTQNSGRIESADMFNIFRQMQTEGATSGQLTCQARPEPWPQSQP